MLLAITIILSLVLTISGYALHRGSLVMAGLLSWLGTGIWALSLSSGDWDTYSIIFWICLIMMFTSVIEVIFLNKGEEKAEEKLEEANAMQDALDEMDAKNKAIAEKRMKGLL
jgi:hypothetical protein